MEKTALPLPVRTADAASTAGPRAGQDLRTPLPHLRYVRHCTITVLIEVTTVLHSEFLR